MIGLWKDHSGGIILRFFGRGSGAVPDQFDARPQTTFLPTVNLTTKMKKFFHLTLIQAWYEIVRNSQRGIDRHTLVMLEVFNAAVLPYCS